MLVLVLVKRLTDFLEAAPDAMLLADRNGSIVAANGQLGLLFGLSAAELAGTPVSLIIEDFDFSPDTPLRHAAERPGILPDGSRFPLQITVSPLRHDDVPHTLAAVRPSAQSAEEIFLAVLESAPDAMLIADEAGIITTVNSQTEIMFGYSRRELIGAPVHILVPDDARHRHSGHFARYAGHPALRPMGSGVRLDGRHRDGSVFPVEISLSPIETPNGLLISSSIRNIAEHRRVEQELQDKNAELERAILAKDNFLASMSHELRTPLNAIIGFTGTMLMRLPGPLTHDQERQLKTIRESGRHLLSLINDLLDLARIESGNVVLRLEAVPAAEVLREVFDTLQPLAAQKALAFSLELPEEELMLRTDRRSLHQILLNLTTNAIKFTEHGSVTLSLFPEQGVGVFRVADTGIGISVEEGSRLFEAFRQAGASRSSRYEGTGLGLYVSRRLAGLLGGSITYTSTVGKGSIFQLTAGSM